MPQSGETVTVNERRLFILRCLVLGYSPKRIAGFLRVPPHSLGSWLNRERRKIGVHKSCEIVPAMLGE